MDDTSIPTEARVLVVDDDRPTLKLIRRQLGGAGFDTHLAASLAEADHCLASFSYDVVLADIFLGNGPANDGLVLLQKSLAHQAQTPVILMTGAPAVDTAAQAMRLGACEYLVKPLERPRMLEAVHRAVRLKRSKEEEARRMAQSVSSRRSLERVVAAQTHRIRETEKSYRQLFESSLDAVYLTAEDGTILDANRAACDLFGYDRPEMTALQLGDLCANDALFSVFSDTVQQQGFIKDFEAQCVRKDGRVMDCTHTASLRIGRDGGVSGIQGIIRDVTERKRAEKKIRDQNAFLRSVIESLTHPFMVVDVETYTIRIANAAALARCPAGITTCHQLLHGLLSPCGESGHTCPVDEIRRTGKALVMQHTHTAPKGSTRIDEIHWFPLFDENRRVRQVILYHIDISERVGSRKALLRLSTAVQQSVDGILITDADGIVVFANPAVERITGFGLSDILDSPLERLADVQAPDNPRIREAMKRGEPWPGEILRKKKDGTVYEEEVVISPVTDEDGRISNFVVVSRDMTHRRRLESIAEAANLMENLGFVFSGIRHEIGNPLNSIKMALTVLKKNIGTFPQEKVDAFVTRALGEVGRIEYLLKSLKSFSMFENLEVQSVQLDDFMKSFLSLVSEDFGRNGIHIAYEGLIDAPRVRIDPRAFHHILLNILTNAADAMADADAGEIRIRLGEDGKTAWIRISDTGSGMSREEVRQLFTPFFTTKANGTGLGLVIVKKMLVRMQGTIRVESEKGQGTTVTIGIPMIEADAREQYTNGFDH